MKLVKLMAMHISKWPIADGEECGFIVQEGDGRLYSTHNVAPLFQGETMWHRAEGDDLECGYFGLSLDLANDWRTAIVTRADWEAERAKLKAPKANGDGWVRNRGRSMKLPVDPKTLVEPKFRSGDVGIVRPAEDLAWFHTGELDDVMRYKIHKPAEQSEPVIDEFIVKDKPCNLSSRTIPHHMLFGYESKEEMHKATGCESIQEIAAMMAKDLGAFLPDTLESVSGPLEWRDRIRELDTQREEVEATYQRQASEITQERKSLVQKLAGEGLALVEVVVQPVEDMSNWRNWREGDLLTLVGRGVSDPDFTPGSQYKFIRVNAWDEAVVIDDAGDENGFGVNSGMFKWHSRPTS